MKRTIAALFFSAALAVAGQPQGQPELPRMIHKPVSKVGLSGETQARAWLADNHDALQLAQSDLVLIRTQESLLAHHYTFAQMVNGVRVQDGEVVVSVDKKAGTINRVSQHVIVADLPLAVEKFTLSGDDAQEVAWQHLEVRGELRGMPSDEQRWVDVDGTLRLAHRVSIFCDEPSGDWVVLVDAVSGEILDTQDMLRDHYRGEAKPPATGPLTARTEAIARYQEKQNRVSKNQAVGKRADGRAMVFDPDPVTTRQQAGLQDNSPSSEFDGTYFERTLQDITESGGTYSLTGPWVRILDFDFPDVAPSTTTDGFWNFTRENVAFHDAMTYYHIDENQRYMQRLGFTGTTGIQFGSIEADANALNGADNSQFSPSANRVFFGHGCVPDNEDADVIIHEYGHAIQFSIVSTWNRGGDEFMLGEAFGDYWAGSWSVRTNEGLLFEPAWVFHWDGHNFCWDGRRMDDRGQQYNPNAVYDRHSHGQIWSTGAFQGLLELMRQGIPREEVDKIILESMFGLGRSVTAPVWCEAIISTAQSLYPDGPHAQVLRNSFAANNIIDKVSAYTYLSAHVPPSTASWASGVEIANPNSSATNVSITTYEDEGSGTFRAVSTESITLSANQTRSVTPAGSGQRWLQITSDQPLSGLSSFTRQIDTTVGRETAAIPLIAETETGTSLVFPHIPADRNQFWSGFVLVNPNSGAASLTFELIGENGSDLSNLLSGGARASLAARDKWVNFLAEGPAGEAGLFDDSGSSEKVAWVRVSSDQQLAGFQLYGYRSDRGEAATAGIIATPNQNRELQPIRVSVEGVDWNGFAVVNPSAEAANLTMTAYGTDGSIITQQNTSIGARAKTLGLNLAGGNFVYPTTNPVLNLDGNSVHTVVVQSNAPLRIFGLTGDSGNTTLDGAAALGLTTNTVFTNPSGTLQIFKAKVPGTLTISRTDSRGDVTTQTLEMAAGANQSIQLEDGLQSVQIQGDYFTSALISSDPERALTVIEGKQIAYNP
ncbi:DUF5719 family protein [Acanthopleuribacter pedis]|uniref:FTP domain-containing protein n=1 Tax=Acanthopleuribacter pedis TaxID=442870 RepID=A0A8J7Q307_9BACT|nr:DUF5719 family protein [Acanthopleuribacter pedis]MBO1317559.1 hypothetical protein [Acanthopleuribacter pedis]